MNRAGLTILMPLKNYHSVFLRKALESVLNQSCPHWRLLTIVEKRDLEHFRKLLEVESADPRIEIITNEGRKLAGALNTGMKYARTNFVAILLGDDMWSVDAVLTLTNYIARFPEVDFFHSSRRYVDEQDRPISSVYKSKPSFTLEDFKSGSPVKHLLCWKKEKAMAFGGMDESLNSVGPDDYDFPWCMAERGAKFMAMEECLYIYRDHRDGYRLTTHLPLTVHKKELRRIMRKHNVNDAAIERAISVAAATYLRQCLYESFLDKWITRLLRSHEPPLWKEKYE
jgi:glycosyltransferase involved in cell wall biosynthesis